MTKRIPSDCIEPTRPDGTVPPDGQVPVTVNGELVFMDPPSGGSLTVQDENGTVATGVTQIDFQGPGFTATAGTSEVVVTSYGTPVLLLAAGAAVPSGTPVGTIIMREA